MPLVRFQSTSSPSESASFEPEATAVLRALGASIASALAEIGFFGKPADIYRSLKLERTLSRQLYGLAAAVETVKSGGMVPSSASMERFHAAARDRGASEPKLDAVRTAYRAFEELVARHAGDRVTFNSMFSAAGGIDEDWLANDLQHRRNAFRAMSHALGLQAKTQLLTQIIRGNGRENGCDIISLDGFVGLRVLRPLPSVRVFGMLRPTASTAVQSPIGDDAAESDHILREFSTSPLPAMTRVDGESSVGRYLELSLQSPAVGITGACTLMFGTYLQGLQIGPQEQLKFYSTQGVPVETVHFDALVEPGLCGDVLPTGRSLMGFRGQIDDPNLIPLQGKFDVQDLGRGPRALVTPQIPNYHEMLDATTKQVGWAIHDYRALRITAAFPLYRSTLAMEWPKSILLNTGEVCAKPPS